MPPNTKRHMNEITLDRPDDWHLHLRDGAALAAVLPHTANCFGRALIMPNLKPPVTSSEMALAYRRRILDLLPANHRFEPLMTLYLTDRTAPEEIAKAVTSGVIIGVKLYPAGATTNSDSGVTDLQRLTPTLEAMAELQLPLLIHGEVTDPGVDIFDRERVFIERHLAPLLHRLPTLRVVLEHVTTREGVEFVQQAGENVAATITAHHLLLNRNAMLAGGIRPHHYCLPVLKRESHREALLAAATSGNPKFFLGTDSAPHAQHAKESSCGCAGLYTAHAAIELCAEAFEQVGALHALESFTSHFGADYYRRPRPSDRITLHREAWQVPDYYPLGSDRLIPLRAGEMIAWRRKE
jgi:dihydroorotase